MRALFILVGCAVTAGSAMAAGPRWWSNPVTSVYGQGQAENNYGPANAGQLKHMARKAKHYLDRSLAAQGGSGLEITAMVLSFEPRSHQNYTPAQIAAFKQANLVPINAAQAKAVLKPFYDRLMAVGYNTKQSLVRNGYISSWAHDYPWNPATPNSANYTMLNIGQLKLMFSFEFDVDQNGLDDNWEVQYFGSTGQNPAGNPDGDAFTNLQESDMWTNPWVWDDPDELDSNGDGVFDAMSQSSGYDPYDMDGDNDGIISQVEYSYGTNPFYHDSDGDDVVDGLDAFPLDPTQSALTNSPGDTTAPAITLQEPPGAVNL